MTVATLLGGDWEYQFEDETNDVAAIVGTRMLKYNSGPVRTTNEVYSALAEALDDFQSMGFKNPMLPVTPNAYTMENQAFISRASSEWLKEGTITADWSLIGSVGNDAGRGVLRVPYTIGVDFVPTDIGKRVTQAGTSDTGTLLDYEVEPDGTLVAWIRPEDSTPGTGDLFDGTGALTVTNGTGATTNSTAATSGITRFTAIQAIGSVPTATEVYIVQDRIKLANSTDNAGFQFWATDPNVSLGIVSVLIRTHNAAADTTTANAIAAGDLEVFARRYTSLYDNFRLNVNAGGFSALPLASAPDINNTTGYAEVTTNAWDAGWTPAVGDVFQDQAIPAQKGVITDVTGTGPNFTIQFYHAGNLDVFSTADIIEDVAQTGDLTLSSNETVVSGGPTDAASGEGGSVTVTLGHTTRDHDNSGTAEPYSVIVDAQTNVPIAKVYERIKYITRRGASTTDLFGVGVNVPGETYRGLQGLYYTNTHSVSLTEGDDLVQSTGGNWTGRLISSNQTGAGEGVPGSYITVTDEQTSLEGLVDTDVVDDEGADQATIDTTPNAALSITSPKSSPLGTFTGTQIFGAQGVDFRNPGAGDSQAYILTDDLGNLRTPPNTISFTVANTRALDRVLVARDTGTAGVIDKDQFGGMAAGAPGYNQTGDWVIRAAGTVDGEVPTVGVVRVVENTLEQEHRYYYDSRTTGALGEFTLIGDGEAASYSSTASAGTSDTLMNVTGATFQTHGVQVGMLVYVAGRTSTYEVVSITDEDTLVIRLLYGAGGFVSTDTYTINACIQNYAATDDLFDLLLDYEEDTGTDGVPGTMSATFVRDVTTLAVVVQVRQGKVILPFEQNQSVAQADLSVTTVRTPDSIAT
jgi:hypothetical protein